MVAGHSNCAVATIESSFVPYHDSIQKIKQIIYGCWLEYHSDRPGLLPSFVFGLALKAQIKVLQSLNSQYLYCDVLWDQDTGLPSHPSLVADVQKFPEILEHPELLETVLKSFASWTLLQRQEIDCCCGGDFKLRKVLFEIMLNHILRVEGNSLIITQLVGVRSDDQKHLKKHYSFSKQSKRADDMHIVWSCANKLTPNDGSYSLSSLESQCAKEFKVEEFAKMIYQLDISTGV